MLDAPPGGTPGRRILSAARDAFLLFGCLSLFPAACVWGYYASAGYEWLRDLVRGY